ncbi:MAG: Eco57I restriction-modification methylase domain-containing protein [Accumulibacter sp.]
MLLQVERELPHLIRQVYLGKGTGLFAQQEQESWQQAEVRLREALTDFAQAAKSTYQGRLFAQDALEGLRLIDLCRTAFDVVVMNPPFGSPTESTYSTIRDCYRGSHNDIYASFVARATELAPKGYVGCISSRSFLLSPRLEHYRVNIVLPRLNVLADLGWGVMDDALVEAAAYVLHGNGSDSFQALDLRKQPGARDALLVALKANENAIVCMKSWFTALPQGKLLYSATSEVRELLSDPVRFEPTGGTAREGMKSFDNFRFIRLSWEIPANSIRVGDKWTPFNKGGEFSFFYSDFHLLLNWSKDGAELRQINLAMNGSTAQVRQASDYWYRAGVTYSKRSSRGFSARALPAGMIFTSNGPAILPEQDISPEYLLGWVNSKPIRAIIHLQSNASDYSTGALKRLPWRTPTLLDQEKVKDCITGAMRSIIEYKARVNETSPWFVAPALTGDISTSLSELQRLRLLAERSTTLALEETSKEISAIYGVRDITWAEDILEKASDAEDEEAVEDDSDDDAEESISADFLRSSIFSYAVGVAFGRFDVRQATGEAQALFAPKAFDPLPKKAPGMLSDGAEPFHVHAGVLVDDQGDTHDLARLVEEMLARVDMTFPDDVRRWLQRDFFPIHLQRYSQSRRRAPIYWPLATTSGSYTLWVYYPNLTSQTLYTAINDFVEPKLKQVGGDVTALRNKGSARTRDDEKQFEALQACELELIELRDTLLKLAPTYKPSHDDGVQISAAPLWPLFRHKPWQKVLKDTWAKLEKGDYDWAHLAMNYWPARVREKCRTDKSLAIAHGLEDLYVEPAAKPATRRGRKGQGG